jgi:uncharacterized protein YbjT (DUF2867 family)
VIVVTGSTGTIGSELVRLLAAAGADTRAIYHRAQSATRLPHVTVFRADLADPIQAEAALAGASSLFLLTGNEPGSCTPRSPWWKRRSGAGSATS